MRKTGQVRSRMNFWRRLYTYGSVGRRPKQFKVTNRVRCVVDAFQTAAGRLKTEDFRGDPTSGSSARGFIGFGDEGGGA